MGKVVLKFLFFACLIVVVLGVGRYWYFLNTPCSDSEEKIVFEVSPGVGLNLIASKLKSLDLISDIQLFKLYVYLNNGVGLLKTGEYLLSPSLTPIEVYAILITGKSILHDITIPEGYNIFDIASLLEQKGLGDKDEFLKLVQDKKIIYELGLEGRSLEGYLFPSTYKFSKSVTTEKIIKTMINKFKNVFTDEFNQRAKEIGFTKHQVVILASMVEKETGNPIERPTIASIFHNRLKKRMRLESDPTVIYGIENFSGNLKREDLKRLSPYNTYKIFGLPEGPIANPGLEAIRAVLWPEETEYLFFVSKNDGTHVFTKNYTDHQKEVHKFQKLGKYRHGKSWRDLQKKNVLE